MTFEPVSQSSIFLDENGFVLLSFVLWVAHEDAKFHRDVVDVSTRAASCRSWLITKKMNKQMNIKKVTKKKKNERSQFTNFIIKQPFLHQTYR